MCTRFPDFCRGCRGRPRRIWSFWHDKLDMPRVYLAKGYVSMGLYCKWQITCRAMKLRCRLDGLSFSSCTSAAVVRGPSTPSPGVTSGVGVIAHSLLVINCAPGDMLHEVRRVCEEGLYQVRGGIQVLVRTDCSGCQRQVAERGVASLNYAYFAAPSLAGDDIPGFLHKPSCEW